MTITAIILLAGVTVLSCEIMGPWGGAISQVRMSCGAQDKRFWFEIHKAYQGPPLTFPSKVVLLPGCEITTGGWFPVALIVFLSPWWPLGAVGVCWGVWYLRTVKKRFAATVEARPPTLRP